MAFTEKETKYLLMAVDKFKAQEFEKGMYLLYVILNEPELAAKMKAQFQANQEKETQAEAIQVEAKAIEAKAESRFESLDNDKWWN